MMMIMMTVCFIGLMPIVNSSSVIYISRSVFLTIFAGKDQFSMMTRMMMKF